MSRVLLVVFAHPDDESFGPGGTLARYAAEGVQVHLACGTRGDVGTVDPEVMQGFTDVGELRWSELEAASRMLGLAGLYWLGYRDSGMPGTEDNNHPQALVRADPSVLVGQIAALMRRLRPQVVLTHDPHGDYGHPDHVAIHRATREAFSLSGDPEAHRPLPALAGLAPYAPAKLYYTAFPRRQLRVMVAMLRLLGRDPTRFGRNRDIDLVEIASWEQPVTTRIDIGRFLEVKREAARCHRSQASAERLLDRIPGPIRRRLLGAEPFTRAVPSPNGSSPLETDLFAGI